MVRAGPRQRLDDQGGELAGEEPRRGLLVLDEADVDGDSGLTDYLALSGELANSVRCGGAGERRRAWAGGTLARRRFADAVEGEGSGAQPGSGGQVTIRKSGNGITYWSAESNWYSADKRLYQQGQLALNITRDYYVLPRGRTSRTDPITYDLNPLKGPVHVGDIVAVKLAVSGTHWKYLLAEDPIPAGTEFLAIRSSTS
jgi:hypothetical protein